jgi:hypothetical protein
MGFLKKHAILALVLTLSAPVCFAEDLRNLILDQEKTVQVQDSNITSLREDYNHRTRDIEKLRQQSERGIISKLLLQKKMKEAQSISKELEVLVKKNAKTNQSLNQNRNKLLAEIDGEIHTLTKESQGHNLASLKNLQKLIQEKEKLISLQMQTLLNIPSFNLSSDENEKEDLVGKVNVVEDLQKNIRQKIAFLKNELKDEQSKEFLKNEISHFLDEENFFGEQSFMSSGFNRRDTRPNPALLALNKGDSGKVPTADVPASPLPADPAATPIPTDSATPETTAPVAVAPPVSSESTSFQQPQQLTQFQNLSEEIESYINEDDKTAVKKTPVKAPTTKTVAFKGTKKEFLEQNLVLSEKILNDLNTLRIKLEKQIQTLE